MAERIARHRAERPAAWRTLEVSTDLAERLASPDYSGVLTVVVEDLTLLLSNLMLSGPDGAEARAIAQAEAVLALEAHVILVSNEVGMGLVPASPLGRRFRDALGRVNQATAAACGEVYLLVA